MHTLAAAITALLDARAEGALAFTIDSVHTPDGTYRLYRAEAGWYAVSRGQGAHVAASLGQLLYAALLAGPSTAPDARVPGKKEPA